MIPATVSTGISSLLAGVTAAFPLSQANISTLGALQQQAHGLIVTIDAALLADDANMVAPPLKDPQTYATQLVALTTLAQEEAKLSELRALVGRSAVNLVNAGV
jgi:hypothetical protein